MRVTCNIPGGTGICSYCMVHASNASINGAVIRWKTLQITAHLRINTFVGSNGWINRFKTMHNITHSAPVGESRSVDSATVGDWKNNQLLQDIKEYDLCGIQYIMFMRLVYYSISNLVISLLFMETPAMVEKKIKLVSCIAPCM
jgi:hypothetical protein